MVSLDTIITQTHGDKCISMKRKERESKVTVLYTNLLGFIENKDQIDMLRNVLHHAAHAFFQPVDEDHDVNVENIDFLMQRYFHFVNHDDQWSSETALCRLIGINFPSLDKLPLKIKEILSLRMKRF